MIRAERRKARANRAKYQGTGNADFVPGSGSGRYGGFSSDAYYASSGASGAYGASGASSYDQAAYDEYDAGDDEDTQGPSHSTNTSSSKAAGPPVADLLSFDDEPVASTAPPKAPQAPAAAAPAPAAAAPLDDFDDFQAAPPASAPAPAPAPASAASQPASTSKNDMFAFLDKPSAPSVRVPTSTPMATASQPMTPAAAPPAAAPPKSSASLFDDLWAESRGKSSHAEGSGKKTMAQLAQDQTSSRVWASSAPKPKTGGPNDLFDLL